MARKAKSTTKPPPTRGPSTKCTLALTLQFCAELRRSYHVTTACRRLGLSRDTVNDWLANGEKALNALQTETEEAPEALTVSQEAWLEFFLRTSEVRAETEQRLLHYVELAAEPAPIDFDGKGRPYRVVRSGEYPEDRLTGDWRAALELLKVCRPDVYGDRQTITHEGGEKPVGVVLEVLQVPIGRPQRGTDTTTA
jgi:hypothetical protein